MKNWFILGLCLLLTGCSRTAQTPPAQGSAPAMSISQVVEEKDASSADGRYEAHWEKGVLTITDLGLEQSMEVKLPEEQAFTLEDMIWTNTDEWDHRLYFSTDQGDFLFIPHGWYDQLGGDTFYCDYETIPEEYDFTQDGTAEEVSILTIIDPNGEDVSWYELWVEQDGEMLLREEFATAHAGYNTLLACRYEGKDCLFRYRPGFGMGYGYYGYQLFTLGEAGQTVQEGSVEFDANFGHPNYQGPFDAAAIAAFFKESYELMESSTLLFSTEGGDLWPAMSGTEFFWEIDMFDLPKDPAAWEQHLRDYAAEQRYESLLAATPVAEVGGEPVSPDGRFRLEAAGESDTYVSGLRPPEKLRLVDEAGNVLWEDRG